MTDPNGRRAIAFPVPPKIDELAGHLATVECLLGRQLEEKMKMLSAFPGRATPESLARQAVTHERAMRDASNKLHIAWHEAVRSLMTSDQHLQFSLHLLEFQREADDGLVVTYSLANARGSVDLCFVCAKSPITVPLGEVQHGAHPGTCEGRRCS